MKREGVIVIGRPTRTLRSYRATAVIGSCSLRNKHFSTNLAPILNGMDMLDLGVGAGRTAWHFRATGQILSGARLCEGDGRAMPA